MNLCHHSVKSLNLFKPILFLYFIIHHHQLIVHFLLRLIMLLNSILMSTTNLPRHFHSGFLFFSRTLLSLFEPKTHKQNGKNLQEILSTMNSQRIPCARTAYIPPTGRRRRTVNIRWNKKWQRRRPRGSPDWRRRWTWSTAWSWRWRRPAWKRTRPRHPNIPTPSHPTKISAIQRS